MLHGYYQAPCGTVMNRITSFQTKDYLFVLFGAFLDCFCFGLVLCMCFVCLWLQGSFNSDKALDMEVIQCSLGSLTLSCCCSVSPYHSSGSTFGSRPKGKTSVSEQDQTSICFYAICASAHH